MNELIDNYEVNYYTVGNIALLSVAVNLLITSGDTDQQRRERTARNVLQPVPIN